MATERGNDSGGEDRLGEIIAAWLEAVESGQAPDRQEWLARYPEFAAELAKFFANQDQIDRLAAPLRPGAQAAPKGSATVAEGPVPSGSRPEETAAWTTDAPASAAPPVGSKVGYFGDYELLEELGRGGMGVVYKARQTSLKRLVALKMILAGTHASAQDVVRFRAEAEAVARLQHPNIVQIHEIGEHEGFPYISLEYVEGGSLDKRLAGTPQPAWQAARLVETLARAMHAAHQRGIVHRDLKPANVLLAADNTPKITDFGLAKLVQEEAGQTKSGSILGTPSYMAPEQAGGKSKVVGPAADIYALGAILYELLTGRPPFRAETPLDTVLQVVSDEPVPPSHLQSKTPGDLETICLKCLQKESPRRYGSADALAEDLRRFQGGEPILARPVGRWEKTVKWVKRNPVVAGLLAAVVLVLVVGTVVSVYFGLDAARQARQARANEAKAVAAKADLEKANEGLKQSREELEDTLARSLLRPLGLGTGPLTDPEIEALWELAENRGERLGQRFVADGLSRPVTTRQLRTRAEPALHAAVGLALDQRALVERLLVERSQDPKLGDGQRTELALVAAVLGDLTPATKSLMAQAQVQAMVKTTDIPALGRLALSLSTLVSGMEPKEAARLCAQAVAPLIHAMGNSPPYAIAPVILAPGLSGLAAYLDPGDAAQAATTLTQVLAKTGTSLGPSGVTRSVAALAGRMEAGAAARLCSQAAASMTQVMAQTTSEAVLSEYAKGIAVLAAYMEAGAAARLCSQAAASLIQAMAKTADPSQLDGLTQGLVAVADHMDPGDNAQNLATLTQAMAKWPTKLYALQHISRALVAVAARTDPKQAPQVGLTLTQAMATTTEPITLPGMGQGLSALATRMVPEAAARLCAEAAATLTKAMADRKNAGALDEYAKGLSALAAFMDPKEGAATLIQAMANPNSVSAPQELATGLSMVAARMAPEDAAAILTQAMAKTTNSYALPGLAQDLSIVAGRMEPKEAAPFCAQAAATLTQAMAKPGYPILVLAGLARGLSAVAARMEPREAARLCSPAAVTLSRAMVFPVTSSLELARLSQSLSGLATCMEPREAAGLCSPAAVTLSRAMVKESEPYFLRELVQGLSGLAVYLGPKDAAQAADILAQALTKTAQPSALREFVQGLAFAASRMAPEDAARLCSQIAATLTQEIAKKTDSTDLLFLADGLSAVAAFMAPADAARLCSQAADTLTQALTKPGFPDSPQELALGLTGLAARMEPRAGATVLIQAMIQLPAPAAQQVLAEGLSAVLTGVEPTELSRRAAAVAAYLGTVTGPGHSVPALALLSPALAPLPCRFSTQELVEFLKQPTCVGGARRGILDQLENRYQHHFADQWAFVRFAQEQDLGLDFTSPPQRFVPPAEGREK